MSIMAIELNDKFMKYISAEKVKDGWLIKITETHIIHSESDVFQMAKQNGMKITQKSYDDEDKEIIKMFGE